MFGKYTLFVLLLLLPLLVAQFSATGFVPNLSSTCSQALIAVVGGLGSPSCSGRVTALLNTSSLFSECTAGSSGVNCFDPDSVNSQGNTVKDLTPAYRLKNQSSCSICTKSDGMVSGCEQLIESVVSASYGIGIDYSSYGITNPTTISTIASLIASAGISCSSTDQASLQILRYQSQVLCASSNTFGYNISSAGTISGVLDLRPLMQCGTCAVLPCLPGQLCDGTASAQMCPESYYCPDPTKKIKCPSGYFCPQGSTAPRKCRGVAGGSCSEEGATREVIWIPLLIAMIIFGIMIAFLQISCSFSVQKEVKDVGRRNQFSKVATNDHFNFSTVVSPVSIEFKDLYLKTGQTLRITNVSGKIRPSRFTAILGGSGAGKTSLMNVILGREKATAGSISYRSDDDSQKKEIDQSLLDRIVAFVPQNDIFLREMTVEELVVHSARWRLPSNLSDSKVMERVEEVLSQLNLQSLRHTPVGGMDQSGGKSLSPGDRKKVNIALELVAGPNVLFLDEPTTGIDASSALNVAQIVSNLAKSGLTCVAVIHQPRSEIFSLIDDMIILTRGGEVAYQGPAEHVMGYLAMFGLVPSSPKANKTDFLIDCTSSPPPKKINSFNKNKQQRDGAAGDADVTWPELWEQHGESYLSQKIQEAESKQRAAHQSETNQDLLLASTKTTIEIDEPRKGFFSQLYLNCYRGVLQHFKQNIFINDALMYLLGGIIMGIVTCGGPLYISSIPYTYVGSCPPGAEINCFAWIRFQIGPATFLISMILGAVTVPGAVRTLGREKEIFAREVAVGANKIAYFLGKIISDFPFMVVNTFLFMAPMVAIAPWQSPLDKLYPTLLCITLVVSTMGYLLSVVLKDPDTAVLVGVILAILLNLFSGFVPTIGDGPIGLIMYSRWVARAISSAELQYGQKVGSVDDFNSVVPDNWRDPDFGYDCGIIVLISVILTTVSYLIIWKNNQRPGSFDWLVFWKKA